MFALLIAMNPTAVSLADKWTQGWSPALLTGEIGTPKAGSGWVVILREILSCPTIN